MLKRKMIKMEIENDYTSDEDCTSDDETETKHDEDDDETFFTGELSNVCFKDILTMKANLGTKVFDATAFKSSKDESPLPQRSSPEKKDKNRPQEVSSKVKSKRSFKSPKVTQPVFRDPRFDSASGEFNRTYFENSYSFINDIRQEETQKIKKLLKKEKLSSKKEKLENLLKSMTDREKSRQERMAEREREKEWRRQEKEKILKGKTPFYLKSSMKKKMKTEEKMKSLEESGKLKNYQLKKEKKRLAKARKHVVNL